MFLFCLCRVVSSLQFAAATYLPVSDVGLFLIRTAPRPRPPALGCAKAGLLAQGTHEMDVVFKVLYGNVSKLDAFCCIFPALFSRGSPMSKVLMH